MQRGTALTGLSGGGGGVVAYIGQISTLPTIAIGTGQKALVWSDYPYWSVAVVSGDYPTAEYTYGSLYGEITGNGIYQITGYFSFAVVAVMVI